MAQPHRPSELMKLAEYEIGRSVSLDGGSDGKESFNINGYPMPLPQEGSIAFPYFHNSPQRALSNYHNAHIATVPLRTPNECPIIHRPHNPTPQTQIHVTLSNTLTSPITTATLGTVSPPATTGTIRVPICSQTLLSTRPQLP